jgi:hypothetical protein
MMLSLLSPLGWPSAASAQTASQKETTPVRTTPSRVHLGATSVTVVDEHDTVDDVITRLRKAKATPTGADPAKSGKPVNATAGQGGHTGSSDHDNEKDQGRAELRAERTAEAKRVDANRPKDTRRERSAAARARTDKKQHR